MIINFIQLEEVMEQHHITIENIYNFDEKGFLHGLAYAAQRVMTREAFESGRVSHARQDGSREFLSLLAYICADSTAGDPLPIYQGASESLKDTWMDDLNITDAGFFTTSSNGWSNHDIGLK